MKSTPDGTSANQAGIVVRLPYLRTMPAAFGSLTHKIPGLCRLWPGLPEMPLEDWFCPDGLPLEPDLAQKYLADLENLDANDLACVQNQALAEENARALDNLSEMDELAAFEQAGIFAKSRKEENLALVQAHKTLLWIWLAQKRAGEIARLAQNFGQSAAIFSNIMAEGEDCPPPGLDGSISLDESILPSWKTVFLNAALFLPEGAIVFAEGPMRADLLEREIFGPAPEFGKNIGAATLPAYSIVEAEKSRLPAALNRMFRVITFID